VETEASVGVVWSRQPSGGADSGQWVISMADRAYGKSRWLTRAVFRVRVSARPCPLSRTEAPPGSYR
jgi:hypothetical protein